MKLLYALILTIFTVSQIQADLSTKLAAVRNSIEDVKRNIDSNDFLVQSKCSGQACGATKCGGR